MSHFWFVIWAGILFLFEWYSGPSIVEGISQKDTALATLARTKDRHDASRSFDHTAAFNGAEHGHHHWVLPTGTRVGCAVRGQACFIEEVLERQQVFFASSPSLLLLAGEEVSTILLARSAQRELTVSWRCSRSPNSHQM